MELFPPEEKGFSYLMLFDDYNKIDLTLLPLEELDNYLKGDKLIKVLIDKDCRIKRDIVPTDIDYHVRKPSAREYDDCCNEFWNVTPYVIKGLCRKEILFAIDYFVFDEYKNVFICPENQELTLDGAYTAPQEKRGRNKVKLDMCMKLHIKPND